MPQSLSKVVVHLVFSTKDRKRWLTDSGIRDELYAYMATALQGIECPALIINGVKDHVHIHCLLSRKIAIKDLVETAKTSSSKWIKSKGPEYHDFYWQSGYGTFSVSESRIERVKRYIHNQEAHHRRRSYQDEFRILCAKHGVELDERYVWD